MSSAMGTSNGSCEIIEVKEEMTLKEQSRGRRYGQMSINEQNKKLSELKLKSKEFLEDDINQLFESLSVKTSAKSLEPIHRAGKAPMVKNNLKKPITVGMPNSPALGNTEPMTLKQALRDLCISKASEMAANKRLLKSKPSSGVSEAGRITNLYNSVVIEARRSGASSDNSTGNDNILKISLVPEEGKFGISQDRLGSRMTKVKSLSQSDHSSAPVAVGTKQESAGASNVQKNIAISSRMIANQTYKLNSVNKDRQISSAPKSKSAASAIKDDSVSVSKRIGRSSDGRSSQLGATMEQDSPGDHMVQNENLSVSKKFAAKTLKLELQKEGKNTPAVVPSSKPSGSVSEQVENDSMSRRKLENKDLQPKSGPKSKLQPASKRSVIGKGVSKPARNTHCSIKPVVRNKGVIKKKIKWRSTSSVHVDDREDDIYNSVDNKNELVCQRCRCALENMSNEPSHDSPEFFCPSASAEVSSTDISPGLSEKTPKGYITVVKGKHFVSKEKGELSQSSGSLGEYSTTTSTSISDDSSTTGLTFANKPHMSKDVRWEAIHNVQTQHGILDLRHFNLLKKLGSGDIGTVYLAELIGTSCLFAIKVMDNEFLARRNKLPRAQTEREILRMLDHPFLPTLYAQFTSDDLSCLVMEYCPGGDLHVLRQRQPTKCFTEPAARFYATEVLLALEYLHMLGIVYRDLKPENILVREDGHIMLTDFDLSLRCDVNPTLLKSSASIMDPARISGPCTSSGCIQPFCAESSAQVSCFSPRFLPASSRTRKLKADLAARFRSLPQLVAEPTEARSNSFVGTHEYLAPEIIKGEGHGAAVDWWTFGVLLYELLYGKTPFKGSVNEETLTNVVLKSLKFPEMPFVSLQAQDLIRGLLVKDPESRLGSTKGAAEIKQHPFFEGLNWALVRCATPPELPECYDFGRLQECKATGDHLEFEF